MSALLVHNIDSVFVFSLMEDIHMPVSLAMHDMATFSWDVPTWLFQLSVEALFPTDLLFHI